MTTLITDHPNAALAQRGFQAVKSGDLAAVAQLLHPDVVVVNDIGAGPWAGTFAGRDAFLSMFGEFAAFLEGSYDQQLVGLWADDNHIIELIHETGAKNGHRFDNRAVFVFAIEDGKITKIWTIDFDRDAVAAFWKAVGR